MLNVRRTHAALVIGMVLLFTSGCVQKQYVRDTEEPRLDEYTMSFNLDRVDLERLYDENVDKMLGSAVAKAWERQAASGTAPSVAIFPIRNESQYVDDQAVDTLLSKFETDLVNRSSADVVSHENQPTLIAEVKRQQSTAYDPARLAQYGRQVGAQFFVTGKLFDNVEEVRGEERVQYTLFIQVIEVETGIVKFQNEAKLTKGYIR